MPQITINPDDTSEEHEEEKFNFSYPESVLIRIYADPLGGYDYPTWKGFSIDETTIIESHEETTGAAGYEKAYGGFLDMTIMGMCECPGEGWFVVEGITGEYHRGDGWTTDDDMSFDHELVRPATEEEVRMA